MIPIYNETIESYDLKKSNLTKKAEAFPLRRAIAESITKILVNKIIVRHSREPLNDQGANFCSSLIKNICEYFRINKIQTTPYNPMFDVLVERFNKTLMQDVSCLQ